MSACAEILAPGVAATSILQSGAAAASERDPTGSVQNCPNNPVTCDNSAGSKAIDDALICKTACCCLNNPLIGVKGQNLMQGCMEETFDTADKSLGYRSRYKPEVSYNMTRTPPTPFMHRVDDCDTTERSHYWKGRAKEEIVDFSGGRGWVRRPDLIIVKDPSLPPTQDNIERIVEFKFRGDRREISQDSDYEKIAGNSRKYDVFRIGAKPGKGERGCDCDEQQQSESIPVPAVETEEKSAWSTAGSALGWSALAAVGAVATAALALCPYEGAAGESLAGSATAAAAAYAVADWRKLGEAF
ncbi:MAG: VRR-NUC domain-containing protein [Gammaproteobacteria bacterium]